MTIFISHSTAQDQFVNTLRTELHLRGYETWVDHFDMPIGAHWDQVVDQALAQCDAMIVIFSDAAVKSDNVRVEWLEYTTQHKPIFPIKLEDCIVPLLLRHNHHATINAQDMQDSTRYRFFLEKLTQVLPSTSRNNSLNMIKTGQLPSAPNTNFFDDDPNHVGRTLELRKAIGEIQTQNKLALGPNQIAFTYPDFGKQDVFDLSEPLIIGRPHADTIMKPTVDLTEFDGATNGVSRQHAMIVRATIGVIITDLGSRNGTFLGNRRAEKQLAPKWPTPLPNRALVYIGQLVVLVEYAEQAALTG